MKNKGIKKQLENDFIYDKSKGITLKQIKELTEYVFKSNNLQNEKEIKSYPLKIVITLIFSVLIFGIVEKKIIILSVFNFVFIFITVFIISHLLIKKMDLKTIDYMLSRQVHFTKHTEYIDKNGWHINVFTTNEKTLYFNQNPRWERVLKIENYTIYKSNFQEYYYLSLKE